MTEQLHFHFSLSCIGEGNGNPLQCSCLENPRDGGAWWAAVYGVAQSRIQLKRLSSSSSSSSRDPSTWQSWLLPFACALSGTAAQKLEAVSGAPQDSSGLWLRSIGSWGSGPLAALCSSALFTRAQPAMHAVKVPGVWGYSLAASIMLAQNRGCLCRGSSSGPLSL